jgi:hypothetical protein
MMTEETGKRNGSRETVNRRTLLIKSFLILVAGLLGWLCFRVGRLQILPGDIFEKPIGDQWTAMA